MKNERNFWDGLAEGFSPGWKVSRTTRVDGEPSIALAEIDSFAYAFDTRKGWLASGGLSSVEVARCVALMAEAPAVIRRAAPSAASETIVAAADADSPFDSEASRRALSVTMGAITQTKTYRASLQGRRAGDRAHWIYIVYRMRDGSQIGRPGCVLSSTEGLLDVDRLATTIETLVAGDTDPASSSEVARMLRAAGGAVLEEGLRTRMQGRR